MCTPPVYGDPFIEGVLNYIDCQTQLIAAGGYQALASPASFAAPWFAGLMTLFVAVLGVRLLGGWAPTIGDGIVTTLKIGVALTLATSWIAYRTLVYDPILKGPAEVGAAIGVRDGLVERLQATDNAIVRLTELGVGRLDKAPPSAPGEPRPIPQGAPIADDLAMGLARIAYLAGAIGALGLARLASGVLLALAPLFAGLLLFDGTRGLFFGWLRTMVAAALGALLITVILAVELGMLEPWLAAAIAQRESFISTTAAPIELFAMTLGFAIILLGGLGIGARMALFGAPSLSIRERFAPLLTQTVPRAPAVPLPSPVVDHSPVPLGRAETVANAVADAQRREATRTPGQILIADRGGAAPGAATARAEAVTPPLGQSYRSTGSRVVSPRGRGFAR